MTARFTGKVSLVTGGGSGIGRHTARALAREGATVVVTGREREHLDQTVELITAAGGEATAVTADVTRAGDVEHLIATVVDRHGGLHVAVNNAGVFDGLGPVADIDDAAWSNVVAVNLTGLWLSMKYEIAYMIDNGGGTIVNVSSVVGPHITVPHLGAYGASKAAVTSLTRTAAKEYIGHGIRINAVSPGPSDTPMSLLPDETEADRTERMKHALPIGRVATLAEVAGPILWLASPESSFTVGHDLIIDGGSAA